MSNLKRRVQALIGELKRRQVTQVALAYCLIGFGLMQAVDAFFPALRFPGWTVTLAAGLIIGGLPIAICLAWMFDITPQGLRATQPEAGTGVRTSARRIAVLGLLVVIVAVSGAFLLARVSTAGHSINAVAVLPFENMSGDSTNLYFSDGMTEEVLTRLAQIDGLKVISRTSAMQYRNATKPIAQIANELHVGAVLEGSVRRVGDNVRITAQLIDASRDEHIWAESYDRKISDIFEVQSEIAQEIAQALRARLSTEKLKQLERVATKSTDAHAYDEYLRGRHHAGANRREESVEHLLRALEIDPNYAPAYATLARMYYFDTFLSAKSPSEMAPKLKAAADRAIQLDDQLAEAHAARGLYLLHFAHDFRGAEAAFRRAIELQPSNAQVHHDYAHYLLAVGRTAESAAESIRAAELDPASGILHACVGWHRFTDGHFQAAITGATAAIQKSPNMGWPKVILAWAHQQTDDHPKAIESLRAAVAATKGRPFFRAQLAHGLAMGGARAEAVQILNDLLKLQPPAYAAAYDIAVIYVGLGDADRAFAWLEKARAERSTFLVFIGWDPRFDALRTDARYAQLIRDMGLPNAPQS